MATLYIPVNTSKRLGADTRQLVSMLQQSKDIAERLKATMEMQKDGNDWTQVETEFGLPAGSGETVYNLISGTNAALGGFDPTALLSRLG